MHEHGGGFELGKRPWVAVGAMGGASGELVAARWWLQWLWWRQHA